MPSAEETTYLIEVMPDAGGLSQDSFTSCDVDVLVSRIKENLRLSGCLKSRSSLSHKIRPSPYRLPSRSWSDPSTCELCVKSNDNDVTSHKQHHHYRRCRKATCRKRTELDDSYERFQALLRKGALIQEAVKRLQTCPDDEDDDGSIIGEEEVDGAKTRRATSTSATSTTLDSMDDEDDDDDEDAMTRASSSSDDFFYRRKRFYYDSEDEPLPTCYQPLDL